MSSSAAYAAGENTNATAVKSTLIDLPLAVGQANCPGPPDSPQSVLPLNVGDITIGAANAKCTSYSAAASVASVRIVDASDRHNTVVLDAIKSSCNRETGERTSTVTLKLGNIGIKLGPVSAPVYVPLGGLGIFLNERVTEGGFNVVNAVRIQVGGPEQGQNLILAQSRCKAYSSQNSSTTGGGGNLLSQLLGGLFRF